MQCYIYVLCLPYIEINPITVAAFGLLAGSAVVVVVVRLFTVGKAVEKSGVYFSEFKCKQKYAPGIKIKV